MGSEVREGFVRQRRNLILGSFLLLFTQISGITISKVNVFGNEFNLAHPYSIGTALWALTVYWFIRYYQYFRELNSSKEIRTACTGQFNDFMQIVAFKYLKMKRPDLSLPPSDRPNAKVTLTNIGYSCLESRTEFNRGQIVVEVLTDDGISITRQIANPVELIIDKEFLWWPRVRAVLGVYINTTKFTEYILPFLVFLMPLLYGLYLLIF